MTEPSDLTFSAVPKTERLGSNEVGFAIADGHPVTPGHTMVVPCRLIATWSVATPDERVGLRAASGQTVRHLHIRVIPRYAGDVADPSGGMRRAIPCRGNCFVEPQPDVATRGWL